MVNTKNPWNHFSGQPCQLHTSALFPEPSTGSSPWKHSPVWASEGDWSKNLGNQNGSPPAMFHVGLVRWNWKGIIKVSCLMVCDSLCHYAMEVGQAKGWQVNVDRIFAAVHRIPFELKADLWWIVCHNFLVYIHMPEIYVKLDQEAFPFTNEESHWTHVPFFCRRWCQGLMTRFSASEGQGLIKCHHWFTTDCSCIFDAPKSKIGRDVSNWTPSCSSPLRHSSKWHCWGLCCE